jgi:hypothetical protein
VNIVDSETSHAIIAKTCGDNLKPRKIAYAFVDSYHSLCLDKKEIILAEIEACERLSKYTRDKIDSKAIEAEIAELKLTLDLLS